MAEYEKVFENPYPNGWEDLPSENTPITASALQEHTDAIENIEQYLEDNPIEQGGSDVEWNQIQEDGEKIAEIIVNGKKTDVFAPQGGGSSSDDLVGTKAEFEAIKDSLPDGSAFDTIDEPSGGISIEEKTISGTTTNLGYLATDFDFNDFNIISANPFKNGYFCLPTRANGDKLFFWVGYVNTSGSIVPFNNREITITFKYI